MDPIRAVAHVGIALGLAGSINSSQLKALEAEAAAIWQPYGVELNWFESNADCGSHLPGDAIPVDWMLRLTADTMPPASAVLGNVQFHDGVPDGTIHLLYPALLRMVLDTTIGNWSIGLMPVPLRDRLVGQALGRVVAHEIGHVLLALPTHDRSGLMRSTFVPEDLIARGRGQLRLSKAYVQRLGRRLNALSTP